MQNIAPLAHRKVFKVLICIALFGLAEWFFGNAYEQIVLVPNFVFGDVLAGLVAYRDLFRLSFPTFFYVPLSEISLLCLLAALALAWHVSPTRYHLIRACALMVIALALTAIIVTQINLKLFFGPLPSDAHEARRLALLWWTLNPLRMVLVAASFRSAVLASGINLGNADL